MEENKDNTAAVDSVAAAPELHVAPAPHMQDRGLTTRRMMIDVLIALVPPIAASIFVFRLYAIFQIGICVACCCAAEALFTALRRRPFTLSDGSAIVTGVILALSMPATAPLFVGVIASFVAIGLGKFIFGGVGHNIFNPAMVGRAFVMLAFTSCMGAVSGYIDPEAGIDALSGASPMTNIKENGVAAELMSLVLGNTNGSLGETSAIACLLGGAYLCIRRTASWEIPAGVLAAAAAIAGLINLSDTGSAWTVLHSLAGGALLFGAFFIATDPVTSPLTPKGKFVFGLGVGALVMLIRKLSSYPEGVMFAVLLMNSLTPLINRWTVPRPFGWRRAKKGLI
jgi:electron transport complex protein RnfD